MARYFEDKVVASGIIGTMNHEWQIYQYKELDWNDSHCISEFYILTVNGDRITGEKPSIIECLAVLVDTFTD